MSYKRINFGELGGLHTWQETFAFMQDSYRTTFGQIAALLGQNVILNGVVLSSGTYSSGWMIVDGVICPFAGGIPGTYITTEELIDVEAFDDATTKDVFFTKRAVFSNIDGVPFADFVRVSNSILSRLSTIEKMLQPFKPYTVGGDVVYGTMLLWKRPAIEIPDGWEPVDDPTINGKTLIALDPTDADFDDVTKTGGSKGHVVTKDNIQAFNVPVVGREPNTGGASLGIGNGGASNSVNIKIGVDSPVAINHLNPYRIVMYIRYVG